VYEYVYEYARHQARTYSPVSRYQRAAQTRVPRQSGTQEIRKRFVRGIHHEEREGHEGGGSRTSNTERRTSKWGTESNMGVAPGSAFDVRRERRRGDLRVRVGVRVRRATGARRHLTRTHTRTRGSRRAAGVCSPRRTRREGKWIGAFVVNPILGEAGAATQPTTQNLARRRALSREFGPTRTSNSPGSTTRRHSALTSVRLATGTENGTVLVSPAFRAIRW